MYGSPKLSLSLLLIRHKFCIHISSLPYVPHAPSISSSISTPKWHSACSTNHVAPHYQFFLSLLLLPTSATYSRPPRTKPVFKLIQHNRQNYRFAYCNDDIGKLRIAVTERRGRRRKKLLYCLKERDDTVRGRSRLCFLDNSLWKRLWDCRKADCRMHDWIKSSV
jgi:hypothetical protein